jgi:hypothetical protein
MPVILATQEAGGSWFKASSGNKSETLSQKYPAQKRTGGVTHVAELLPSRHEALNSKPSTSENQKTKPNKSQKPYFQYLLKAC